MIVPMIFFVVGACFFLVRQNWLVVHWVPSYSRSEDAFGVLGKKTAPKKTVSLMFWKDGKLQKETASFLWLASKAEIVKLVLGNWLTLLYEERVLAKGVNIESVALSSSEQEVYISFDQLPFLREWSIQKKWQLLDGLSKTVCACGLGVRLLVFLVRHETMQDDQLDFSQPWPVDGFE
jgi:hypothetical protein